MTIHDGEGGFWDTFIITTYRGIFHTVCHSVPKGRNTSYIIDSIKRNVKN